MKYRRGQAALEFLSTYGFAFLIILVMVGALTYFGVLNPSGLVPNKCVGGNGIKCNEVRFERPAVGTVLYAISLESDRGTSTTLGFQTGTAAAPVTVVNFPGYGTLTSGAAAVQNCAAAGAISCVGYIAAAPAAGAATSSATAATAALSPAGRYYIHGLQNVVAPATSFPGRGEKLRAGITVTYQDAGSAFPQPQSLDITQTIS